MKKFAGVSTVALAAAMMATAAHAADAPAPTDVSAVIVTGTRVTGMKAADSAAPIQLVGAEALKRVGQPDLMQALSQTLPSFNAQGYGADTAALTLSAALRGLNPNDTLVLVDGKRRHTTANLAVDTGSAYQGSATTDLSFIPVAAIDHIEVLQDGAAAQYGTDAIAGVVNIILKKNASGGSISATGGQYFGGDGDTGALSLNNGFALGDKGFVNVTLDTKYHGFSRQGGADRRFYNVNGTLKSGLDPVDVAGLPGPKDNNIYGDPRYQIYSVFFNAGYQLSDNLSVYSFGSFGHRNASAYENYRRPTKISGVTSLGATVYPLPRGFSPREGIKEDDFSITAGIKGTLAGWDWDLSTTYGKDKQDVYTLNSANGDLYPVIQAASPTLIAPQRNFFDGTFSSDQAVTNFDVVRSFNVGLASPLSVAAGFETRHETFEIGVGDPNSYYGAGAQSFTGYGPSDAGGHGRNNYGFYVDLAVDPIKNLHLDVAGRTEHYSDFGDTTVGKLTGRYDFSPAFAIRGTASTGFRAPTLAEEFYSGTNVSPSFAQVQLPANSAAAGVAGFKPLKAEQSDNYSVGFVAHPLDKLQITADFYQIKIKKRIVGSGFLLGSVLNSAGTGQTVVSQAILNAITAHGNTLDSGISYAGITIFTNGADTETTGAEITANYATDFGDMGHVDWSLGLNFNENKITKQYSLPAIDTNVGFGQTAILTPNAISALTKSTPKQKLVAGAFWTNGAWSANLRESLYGESSQIVSLDGTGSNAGATNVKLGTQAITDFEISYQMTKQLKLSLGANNLFDLKPKSIPNVSDGSGGVRPADGNNVYGEPVGFSPYGINGGYYYGRITFNW